MTNINQNTVWKPYPECPLIEADQFGDVRIKDRYVKTKKGLRFVKGRVLKQIPQRNGYMKVRFSVDNKKFYLFTHRIVATCFIPNPLGLPEVNHIDCDKANNSVSNLEWCSHEYNIQYREKYGKALGHPVIVVNLKTLKVLSFKSQREAGRQLNIDNSDIAKVVKGKKNKINGYWFCDADENAIEKAREKFGDDVASEVEKLMA